MNNHFVVQGIPKTLFGAGAIRSLAQECLALGGSPVLLVMDRSLSQTPLRGRVEELLAEGGVSWVLYGEITPEPSPELADRGAQLARREGVRVVVGVGGGSTLDVAKAIAALVTNPGTAEDYVGLDLVKEPALPSVMVPTTAGTGSEVTFTAVFTMRETRTKGGINSPRLYPRTAILDPELTITLPPWETACTGMDALTHAIESYTSRQAHFWSEPHSLRAVELIGKHLRGAVHQGDDLHHRTALMKASFLGGLGLAMAGVGAVHALAYPLGALFDIPHGLANATLLPYVLQYNLPGNLRKHARLAQALGESPSQGSLREGAETAVLAVVSLAQDIGIPESLKELGIPEEAIREMADSAMKVARPMANNPRPVTVEAAMAIYRNAFAGQHLS